MRNQTTTCSFAAKMAEISAAKPKKRGPS
jgi:hypothetical protein